MGSGFFHRQVRFLHEKGILKSAVTAEAEDASGEADGPGGRLVTAFAKAVATGLFVGYVPFTQGTFGALWVPVLYEILKTSASPGFIGAAMIVSVAVLYSLGVWASGVCERIWGHDPGRVVIDEVVGMLVTLLFIPLSATTVWAGFFLFRAFDIFKPPPVKWFERFGGGFGVMNDDVAAGVYANICLRLLMLAFG
ncbi:MAG: phosphatidylglycerophosphatase A [Candidatus Latescibacteria bacterium]|nr:phosphatidylglycerophosphatase A [Candidatus Latescibacterota bacterium]